MFVEVLNTPPFLLVHEMQEILKISIDLNSFLGNSFSPSIVIVGWNKLNNNICKV